MLPCFLKYNFVRVNEEENEFHFTKKFPDLKDFPSIKLAFEHLSIALSCSFKSKPGAPLSPIYEAPQLLLKIAEQVFRAAGENIDKDQRAEIQSLYDSTCKNIHNRFYEGVDSYSILIPKPPVYRKKVGEDIPGLQELIQHLPLEEREVLLTPDPDLITTSDLSILYEEFHNILKLDPEQYYSRLAHLSKTAIQSLLTGKLCVEEVASLHMLTSLYANETGGIILWCENEEDGFTRVTTHKFDNHKRRLKLIQRQFSLFDKDWQRYQEILFENTQNKVNELYYHLFEYPLNVDLCPLYERLCEIMSFLCPASRNNRQIFIIPSYTMLKSYLILKAEINKQSIPNLVPCFGALSFENVARWRALNYYPLGLYCFEQTEIHKQARTNSAFMDITDGYLCTPLGFWIHDLFHVIREMQMTCGIRLARMHIVGLIERYIKMHEKSITRARIRNHQKLIEKLIDGELIISYSKNEFSAKVQPFGAIFETHQKYWSSRLIYYILNCFAHNRESWKEEFGITADDLLPSQKMLMDILIQSYH